MAPAERGTDYFQLTSPPTFISIVIFMMFGWTMWYDVNLLPTSYMSYLGDLLHYIGTNFRSLLLFLNVAGLIEHACLSFYGAYISGKLDFSAKCTAKWIAQTLLLGYFSLSLLIAHYRRYQ
ncbi:unnamed protein product [Toxocara canis]|nr:unnamed protein product [Toxocara canis]